MGILLVLRVLGKKKVGGGRFRGLEAAEEGIVGMSGVSERPVKAVFEQEIANILT